MSRSRVNLDHHVVRLLKIGRMVEVCRFPVLPGDSIEGKVGGEVRLPPFMREIVFDVNFEMAAFYCPYRYTYGNTTEGGSEQGWYDFLMEGYAAEVNKHDPGAFYDALDSSKSPGPLKDVGLDYESEGLFKAAQFSDDVDSLTCLMLPHPPSSSGFSTIQGVPVHIVADYLRIWNYYIRNARIGEPRVALRPIVTGSQLVTSDIIPPYGRHVTHMQSLITSLYEDDPTEETRMLIGLQSVASASPERSGLPPGSSPAGAGFEGVGIDMRKVRQGQKLAAQEAMKYLVARYQNASTDLANARDNFKRIHQSVFGVSPRKDILDPRPELIARTAKWMSARQVEDQASSPTDSTDPDASPSLGASVGKIVGHISLTIPRKLIPEHGSVVVVMIPRFPPLFQREMHFLDNMHNFKSYVRLSGDRVLSGETPIKVYANDVFADVAGQGTGNDQLGFAPHNAYYRSHPNFIDPALFDENFLGRSAIGYPFIDHRPVKNDYKRLCRAVTDGPTYPQQILHSHFGVPVRGEDGSPGGQAGFGGSARPSPRQGGPGSSGGGSDGQFLESPDFKSTFAFVRPPWPDTSAKVSSFPMKVREYISDQAIELSRAAGISHVSSSNYSDFLYNDNLSAIVNSYSGSTLKSVPIVRDSVREAYNALSPSHPALIDLIPTSTFDGTMFPDFFRSVPGDGTTLYKPSWFQNLKNIARVVSSISGSPTAVGLFNIIDLATNLFAPSTESSFDPNTGRPVPSIVLKPLSDEAYFAQVVERFKEYLGLESASDSGSISALSDISASDPGEFKAAQKTNKIISSLRRTIPPAEDQGVIELGGYGESVSTNSSPDMIIHFDNRIRAWRMLEGPTAGISGGF